MPPRGLSPYCGEVCMPQWLGELCWRERKLLVAPPMPDRSKGQTKCSPWSSRLGVGRGTNDHTSGKFTVTKPRRRPSPTQGCSARREEELCLIWAQITNLTVNCTDNKKSLEFSTASRKKILKWLNLVLPECELHQTYFLGLFDYNVPPTFLHTTRTALKTTCPTILLLLRVYSLPQ
jgi:hypothetical protein